MRKHISTAFRATPLAYSSPAFDTTSPTPACFYNAFPDLNDKAPDDSQSAFPLRAKYSLALDSEFLPSARRVNCKDIDDACLMSLDSIMREKIIALIGKVGHQNPILMLPRKPELNYKFRLESLFEITHKRLAASDYKWKIRTYNLASLYTALEEHLVRGKKIGVPLVANPRGSRLQRHWKTVVDAFEQSCLIDEVASLLITLTLLSPEERKVVYEQGWIEQEEAENPGFADFYQEARERFNPDSCTSETDRKALAEQILQSGKVAFSLIEGNISLTNETLLNLDNKNQSVFWPSLLGEEVHRGLPQLRAGFVLGDARARTSIPQTMQCCMAAFCVWADEELSFTRKDDTWPEHVVFSLESMEDMSYPRIVSEIAGELLTLAFLGFNKPDGSRMETNSDHAPSDIFIAESICRYTIFLESIRQQICTGVGLRCPFWKGSGCCEFRPLLQRTYDVCKPYYPPWKHHWQRPPCLA